MGWVEMNDNQPLKNADLGVSEGDRVRFEYRKKHDDRDRDLREKTGTVEIDGKSDVAIIDVDGAGRWWLRHGAVEVITSDHDIHRTRYHGSLYEIEVIDSE